MNCYQSGDRKGYQRSDLSTNIEYYDSVPI
jgi:hypothetical protein